MGDKSDRKDDLFEFLKDKYTPLGITFIFMIIASFLMLFLEQYFYEVPQRLVISAIVSFIIISLYGSISMYACQRGGSSFGMLLRVLFFLILSAIFFTSALIHWKYGLIALGTILIVIVVLMEKSKSKVIQEYSTRDLLFNNQQPRNILSKTLEKLGHEVMLGPGYRDKIIGERVADLKRAIELGATEISKGFQESNYMELQSQLRLVNSRLTNISNEEGLYNLHTNNKIKELEHNIQQLTHSTCLSNLLNDVQKNELLIQIVQYKIHLAKLSRLWQHIHQPNSNYETGFE